MIVYARYATVYLTMRALPVWGFLAPAPCVGRGALLSIRHTTGATSIRAPVDEHRTLWEEVLDLLKESPEDAVTLIASLESNHGLQLLSSQLSMVLDHSEGVMDLAKASLLEEKLVEGGLAQEGFCLRALREDILPNLETPWAMAIKKWRMKALAVEKYRTTNPTYVASIYTYMVNTCLRQGMWEVAYDALAYSGMPPAGPFFVSEKDIGGSAPAMVLDLDRMACYAAEQILDMDLDAWRRRGGDSIAGAGTVGNAKPGVGIEERNFRQNDESISHGAALRVQDLVLASTRVALCKMLQGMEDGGSASDSDVVVLCSAKAGTLPLQELLPSPTAVRSILALDFDPPLAVDEAASTRLAESGYWASDIGADRGRPLVLAAPARRGL